jgi:DNA invertase Pin-like site-specific DNA recombinase
MQKLIAYYRVSTKRQGQSGLGLEGQRAAVEAYAKQHGAKIVTSYTEVESGKRADRPELAKAIPHAKLAKAKLVVAKLDRLARNVAFLSSLMESGCDFVACDNPHANKLTIHILAAVAQDEAERISERTKAALKAAKRRGVMLGSARPGHWKGREHLRGWRKAVKVAAVMKRQSAMDAYGFLLPMICERRREGASFQTIANELNCNGHLTTAECPFTATAVWRVLSRSIST